MEQINNTEIVDKMTKVCICKGISKATMKKVIQNGARTVEAVNRATGSGSGSCQGKRCSVKINEMLEEMKL
jgi:bacterioferritin-associated ferredoxin